MEMYGGIGRIESRTGLALTPEACSFLLSSFKYLVIRE